MSENQNENQERQEFGKIIPITWKERLDPPKEPLRQEVPRRRPVKDPPPEQEPADEGLPPEESEEEFEKSLRKRVREKVREQKRERRRKRLKRLAVAAVLLFICAGAFLLIFRLQKIELAGNVYYTEEQFVSRIQTGRADKNTLLLYLKLKRMKPNSLPFIENLEVEMTDTHSLKVTIYEKSIIGCIHYMSQYIFFDKDGMVVETKSEPKADIPVISGLQMKSFALFQTMKIEDESLFSQVLGLSQLIRKYELEIDRIEFDLSRNVTLYSEEIEIRLGKRDMYDDQLAELKNLLPAAKGLAGILDMKDYQPGQSRIILQEKER